MRVTHLELYWLILSARSVPLMKADPVPICMAAKIEMLVNRDQSSTICCAGLDRFCFQTNILRHGFRGINELGVNFNNTVFGSRFQARVRKIGRASLRTMSCSNFIALVGVNDISVYPAEGIL